MKKHLPKLVFVVAVLLTISIVFMSCQREIFSEVFTDGMIALNEKKYDEALEYLSRAIELEPDFAETYFLRALAFFRMEIYEDAIADFTSCVKYDPNHAEAYYWRGEAYYDLEDYSNAISSYNKAIELDPDKTCYYYSRGSSYYLRDSNGDIYKAIDDFRKGCELGDKSACYRFNSLKSKID